MSNRAEILFPVGRMVQGSLYEPQTTNMDNKPLTTRDGKERVEYFFTLAVPKGSESHWSQTAWGAVIWAAGHAGFPKGQAQSPTFAWKIQDGDSNIPNKVGRKNCDKEGFPGNWVLNFSCGFASKIISSDGITPLLEDNAVNLGDYIEVFGTVTDNGSEQQPGIFLNHGMVCFRGFGQRIILGPDPKNIGFGKSALPMGASMTPPPSGLAAGASVQPPPPIAPTGIPAQYVTPPPVVPHTGILTPPVPGVPPAVPQQNKPHIMTAAAGGCTYEQLRANGWNDEQLVQHGMMLP